MVSHVGMQPARERQYDCEISWMANAAQGDRLEDDWVPTDDGRSLDEVEEAAREREAAARAVVLEMIGDLPEADAKPPSDMLFVCKLNPVTTEEVRRTMLAPDGRLRSLCSSGCGRQLPTLAAQSCDCYAP